MDQLKVILRQLLKYHFWVLIGLMLLAGLVVWIMATGDLEQQYGTRKRKLDGEFGALTQIRGQPDFPNTRVIDEIKKTHGKLKGVVFQASQILYSQQEKENPWPKVLGPEFLDFVNNKSNPPDVEIPTDLRSVYQNFIGKVFPQLFALVSPRVPIDAPAADAAAKPASGEGPPVKYKGVVDWDESSRNAIEAAYRWNSTPSTLQVRMAQEDLWVYEALLRIIKEVNAGVTEHYNAYIKRIDVLEIGPAAAAAWSQSEAFNTHFNKEEAGNVAAGAMPQPAANPGEPGAAAGEAADKALMHNRYVDEKGKPLPFGTPQPFHEFKMMPVHIKLLIDQSRIPHMVVDAANCSMPVEFRVVRLNPESGKNFDTGATSAEAGAAGPAAAAPGAAGAAPGPGGPGTPGAEGHASKDDDADPLNATLELFGIIYIFNPPDKANQAEEVAPQQAPPTPAATPTRKS